MERNRKAVQNPPRVVTPIEEEEEEEEEQQQQQQQQQHCKFMLHTLQVLYTCTICDSTKHQHDNRVRSKLSVACQR